MRVLLVFLFVVLGCRLAEGHLVSKCDLKKEIMQKLRLTENIVAKIVCHVEQAAGFNTSAVNQLDEEGWTLYGLFQLSNHLVCSDGTTPSPNICGMECDNLTDDDIRDDITCLLDIFKYIWIKLIFQRECSGVNATEFFAECHNRND